jgi:hypothetical protein
MSRSDFMFLLEMDATREVRTMGRPDHCMMDGFRVEWNKYVDEWLEYNADNN